MDPFTVSTACVGLLAAVAQLSAQIAQFVSGVREARRDMDSVSRELSSLALCLETLRDDSTTIQYPDGLRQTLVAVLGHCDTVTQQMHTLLEKMSSHNLGRRAQWVATGRDDMNRLRSSLEAYKSALDIALEVTAISIISAVKDDVKDVKADTAAIKEETNQIPNIKHDTSSLIQEIAFLRLQVTELQQHDTGGGLILQRFLQESTTYAETVIDALDEGDDDERYPGSPSPKPSLDIAARTLSDLEHPAPLVSADERKTSLKVVSEGQEGESSIHGQITAGSRTFQNSPSLQGPEIVGGKESSPRTSPNEHLPGRVLRKSPDKKAMVAAAAARSRLSLRERKRLDDRLETLIRGKKSLKQIVKLDDIWWGRDQVGGATEIRAVLDAGGTVNIPTTGAKSIQEGLYMELQHFRRPDVVTLLLSFGALENDARCLAKVNLGRLTRDVLQCLLEYWEDPNIPNGDSGTALYQCAAWGATDHVALLLEHGADPSTMNAHITEYLSGCPRYNGINFWKPNKGSPLNIACYNGHLDTVKVLIEGGAEVNSPADGPFHTPAQYLVEGARAAVKGGRTTTEYKKIKKILESAGANEIDWELW